MGGSQPENPGLGGGKLMGHFSREHWLMFLPLLVSASYSDGCVLWLYARARKSPHLPSIYAYASPKF